MAYIKIDGTDPRHATLQKGFNLRWPPGGVDGASSPHGARFIYLCRTESEIVDAAADALRENNGRITVRSGGHCYEGFVSNRMPNNPLEALSIIDIGQMTGMDYDENGKIRSTLVTASPYQYKFRVAAGNQNWNGYVALYKESGKTIPGGSCYSVGAGGHICGGGYGFLSRMHGLTCDWLSGVDMLVPTTDGRGLKPIHVSRGSTDPNERNLLAACCGAGGGQFGIITSYYFEELPDAPREVLWLPLTFPLNNRNELANLLHAYYRWFAENQDDSRSYGLATKLELRHFSSGLHTLGIHYVDEDGGVEYQDPFNRFVETMLRVIPSPRESLMPVEVYHVPRSAHPTERKIGSLGQALAVTRRMDWLPFTQLVNGSGENQHGRYKSAYQKGDFTDTVIDGIWEALNRDDPDSRQTQSLLQIQSYGGKINQPDDDTWEFTSVAQRSSLLKWQPQTYWRESSEEADAEHAAWIRYLYAQAFAESRGIPLDDNFEGCYINYPDLDMTYIEGLPERGKDPNWYSTYFPDPRIRKRLIGTKNYWDPSNLFRNEMSVPLE